jgi:hypothetical protein
MENRLITEQDRGVLETSLAADQFHKDTTSADFFYGLNSECRIYTENEQPVAFVRCSKALRLDIQFVSNDAKRLNARLLLENLEAFCQRAADSGYSEIVFESSSPELVAFCVAKCGFTAVAGELRKLL